MEDNKSQEAGAGQPSEDDNRDSARIPFGRYLLYALAALTVLVAAVAIAFGAYVRTLVPKTPTTDELLAARHAQASMLLSANGTPLAVFSDGNQERVDLSQVSPHVIDALVATEDHRFFEHSGVDVSRTLAAVFHTLNGAAQGGSTITQQLARNLFPQEIGRSRTIERKLREMITAIKIEKAYTKEQILETYLNTVPFLFNARGIEMAARTYYDKSAADLDLQESATLVGMLKGTSYYNPVLHPKRALHRRNVVLAQMVKHGMLEYGRFESLRGEPLNVRLHRQPDPLGTFAPHFAGHVRKWMVEWAESNGHNLFADGLVIESTLDDRLQQAATTAVERQAEVLQNIADVEWGERAQRVASLSPGAYAQMRKRVEPFRHFWQERPDLLDAFVRETPEFKKAVAAGSSEAAALAGLKDDAGFMARLRSGKTRLEAGFVAVEPDSGEIKAWVGSRSFDQDQFDHVAQAVRQPGSTFKPIVYAAALEQGLPPDYVYVDGPVEIRTDDGSIWRPTNMSGPSGQMMSLRDGLIHSKNTITAQVMMDVGLPQVVDLAKAVGIDRSPLHAVPSLSLGTSPVTLLEMVSAYATIARIGEHRKPLMVRRILDRNGKVLAEFGTESSRAMSESTAVELIDMLRGVVRQGTGQVVRNQFNITADVAGKTGTTQNNTDGWFILMHPGLVAGAWVGFNDSRVTMRSDHWGQGGQNAVLLVGDFFRDTLKEKLIDAKATFPKPKYRPPPVPLMVEVPKEEPVLEAYSSGQPLPPGHGIVTSSSGDIFVVGPDGVRKLGREEAARVQTSIAEVDRMAAGSRPDASGDGARLSVDAGAN